MTRLLSLTLLLFLIPLTSFGATTLVPTGCQAGCPCTLCDFYLLAHNIITILFELMAIIAVLSFLYGGILIMTSGGSEGKVKQGKDAITSAVIGALIAGLAWLFFSAALNSLTFGIKTVTLDGFFKPLACNTGGGESCNTTFKPKPPPAALPSSNPGEPSADAIQNENAARAALGGIPVNNPPCPAGVSFQQYRSTHGGQGCTTVAGLSAQTLATLKDIHSRTAFTISGGTEAGHASHGTDHPSTIDVTSGNYAGLFRELRAKGYNESNFGRGYTCEDSAGHRIACSSGSIHHAHLEL
ncbi:MAG: pilin [Patescibacteria group bacterium]